MRRSAGMFLRRVMTITLLLVLPNVAQGQMKIAKSGRTSLNRAFGTQAVKVSIDTIRVNSGSDAFPKVEWLAGIEAVTLVRGLEISVDGKSLFVPRSVFADLVEPRRASVEFSNGTFILNIIGADGAEAYFIHVYFDAAKVKRRTLCGAFAPDKPTEDTKYRLIVMKDE